MKSLRKTEVIRYDNQITYMSDTNKTKSKKLMEPGLGRDLGRIFSLGKHLEFPLCHRGRLKKRTCSFKIGGIPAFIVK